LEPNISGTLGIGQVLDLIGLPSGLHHITLTAIDSGGNQIQAAVSILVADLSKRYQSAVTVGLAESHSEPEIEGESLANLPASSRRSAGPCPSE
jgi:hypothetical protein